MGQVSLAVFIFDWCPRLGGAAGASSGGVCRWRHGAEVHRMAQETWAGLRRCLYSSPRMGLRLLLRRVAFALDWRSKKVGCPASAVGGSGTSENWGFVVGLKPFEALPARRFEQQHNRLHWGCLCMLSVHPVPCRCVPPAVVRSSGVTPSRGAEKRATWPMHFLAPGLSERFRSSAVFVAANV